MDPTSEGWDPLKRWGDERTVSEAQFEAMVEMKKANPVAFIQNYGKLTPDEKANPLQEENLPSTVNKLKGPGLAALRSSLTREYGVRLRSSANRAQSLIVFQTLNVSPDKPLVVTIDQFIEEPFTGPGQFDLVERESIRRVFDGASDGGTPVLSSASMNWQPEDEGEFIHIGKHPGRFYRILSVEDSQHVTLNRNITLPSANLTLEMVGKDEIEIATKSGITNGITNSEGWSHFEKIINTNKIFRVDFTPGDTGIGVYLIRPRALYSETMDVDQSLLPS